MLHHYYGLGKAPWFTDDIYEGFDSDSCEWLDLDTPQRGYSIVVASEYVNGAPKTAQGKAASFPGLGRAYLDLGHLGTQVFVATGVRDIRTTIVLHRKRGHCVYVPSMLESGGGNVLSKMAPSLWCALHSSLCSPSNPLDLHIQA